MTGNRVSNEGWMLLFASNLLMTIVPKKRSFAEWHRIENESSSQVEERAERAALIQPRQKSGRGYPSPAGNPRLLRVMQRGKRRKVENGTQYKSPPCKDHFQPLPLFPLVQTLMEPPAPPAKLGLEAKCPRMKVGASRASLRNPAQLSLTSTGMG